MKKPLGEVLFNKFRREQLKKIGIKIEGPKRLKLPYGIEEKKKFTFKSKVSYKPFYSLQFHVYNPTLYLPTRARFSAGNAKKIIANGREKRFGSYREIDKMIEYFVDQYFRVTAIDKAYKDYYILLTSIATTILLMRSLGYKTFLAQYNKLKMSSEYTTMKRRKGGLQISRSSLVYPLSYRTLRKRAIYLKQGRIRPGKLYGNYYEEFDNFGNIWKTSYPESSVVGKLIKLMQTNWYHAKMEVGNVGPESLNIPGIETGKLFSGLAAKVNYLFMSYADMFKLNEILTSENFSRVSHIGEARLRQDFRFGALFDIEHGRGRSIKDILHLHARGFRLVVSKSGSVMNRIKNTKTYKKLLKNIERRAGKYHTKKEIAKLDRLIIGSVKRRYFLLTREQFNQWVLTGIKATSFQESKYGGSAWMGRELLDLVRLFLWGQSKEVFAPTKIYRKVFEGRKGLKSPESSESFRKLILDLMKEKRYKYNKELQQALITFAKEILNSGTVKD